MVGRDVLIGVTPRSPGPANDFPFQIRTVCGYVVSRIILLCLGYGLFSLFATWFSVLVAQCFIHAQLRSPPRRSGCAET